jgi:hypothetical protein
MLKKKASKIWSWIILSNIQSVDNFTLINQTIVKILKNDNNAYCLLI